MMSAGRRRSGNSATGTSTEDQALNQIASEVVCCDIFLILCRILSSILALCVQTVNLVYNYVFCERQSLITSSRNVIFPL